MVAAAGLYMEFFLAALAAIIWARTAPGALNTLAYDAVIAGTVLTLFFNINPLMRFDGYFILSDLLQVPNLSTRGGTWMRRALTWLLLGTEPARQLRPTTREGWIVALYGGAAWVWQIVIIAGLLVAASVTLRGGGLLLAVIAGIAWVALPLGRFASSMLEKIRTGSGNGSRLLLRAGALSAVLAALVFFPWHRSVSSDGVVELAETQVLRAECPGFIVRELVQDGETVEAGQLLVELSNIEAAAELARCRLALAQQEQRARLAYTRDDISAFQAEQARSAALRKEIAERERYLGTLQIRAPFAGRVANRQLGRLRGVFFKAGQDVLHFGRAGERELKVAVSERDEPHFRGAVGESMSVRIMGRAAVLSGELTRVEARATQAPVHPALTALAGGPLAVRRSEDAPAEPSRPADYELAQPYFTAIVRLAEGVPLAAGEMARVRFRSSRTDTLWSETQGAFSRWLKRYAAQEH
jgi:putative peptide zinc metalloprotease protein